ncbi:bacillithiol biosynthesis deacetylase BshB1 [Anaerobacillus sp. MEB173]|uniref:bacillithiol biosynthesis deacetylase BshB1 n=1 Tax=Anaerobacillus sp. MEB173 TaxID=3383345 RepID=UPI003F90D5DD
MSKDIDKLDILAIGAHPDDIEIGMGGTIAKYVNEGYNVGICSLTKAELSSNGTVETRQLEAERSASILGVSTRLQLDFPDRGLRAENHEQIEQVVKLIRTYKPNIVFAPYFVDRHPDHGHCSALVKEAVFSAGIGKFKECDLLPAHRVDSFYYYLINGFHKPDFIIDISEEIEKKVQALSAYESQFIKTEHSVETPLTNDYIQAVENRERLFGKEVGVCYGEGFICEKPILVHNLLGGRK